MIKLLKYILVIQSKEIDGYIYYRYNPWNPLTYLLLLFIIPTVMMIAGFNEIKNDIKTVFKWE